MKKINQLVLAGASMLVLGNANAGEQDVADLEAKVNLKVQQIEEIGLLPTSVETEVIMGDIVFEEVRTTELTVEQAVEKYQLTPTLERYIKIKQAQFVSPGVVFPPDEPPKDGDGG